MSNAAITLLALALFSSIALGLWDLFHGLSVLAGLVSFVFVAAGAFNVLSVLKRRS